MNKNLSISSRCFDSIPCKDLIVIVIYLVFSTYNSHQQHMLMTIFIIANAEGTVAEGLIKPY